MNKYMLFAIVIISVILMITLFGDSEDETSITGYADNTHQTENGTTFTINDANGNAIRAFSRIDIDDSLHIFKGSYSQDGDMFFVNEID